MDRVFVTYAARRFPLGGIPLIEMEVDGQLISTDDKPERFTWYAPELAVENERWVDLASRDAVSGRVEFTPDDDSDSCLFWRLVDGVIQIRAYGTLLQLDVSHINQPSAPSTLEIGGEG